MIHETKIRVRYGETDQMGFVYYGNYALYFEIGRVEMLRSVGITYKDMESVHKVLLPVANMSIKYIRPAHYDELLTVKTEIVETPSKFVHFKHTIFNEKDKLINEATVTLCFVDQNTMRSTDCPSFLKDVFGKFMNE